METDFEKEFQRDLEKAAALSLESLALEQYRRSKSQFPRTGNVTHHCQNEPYLPGTSAHSSAAKGTTKKEAAIVPPPSVSTRRHSEVHLMDKHSERDLISFSSPTSIMQKDDILNFDKLVSDIQKLNTQEQQTCITNQQHNLQIVPYNIFNDQQTHKNVLTNEQLNRLYSMPQQVQYNPYFVRPFICPVPQASISERSNFLSSQGYGFHKHIFQQPHPSVVSHFGIQSNFPPNQSTSGISAVKTPPSLSVFPQLAGKVTRSESFSLLSKNTSGSGDQRRKFSESDNLIDFDQVESSRVSVLEAFDPLVLKDHEKSDNASDCATSYYSECDPFDYLYSGGTQYSDPVYDAVNKTDKTPLSPNVAAPALGWNIPTNNMAADKYPPPLPPRNSFNDFESRQVLDRRKFPTKLYENVVDCKSYDVELMEFYNMVKSIRANYKFEDLKKNIGHVVASEFINQHTDTTSIKILVHPAKAALKYDVEIEKTGQVTGYGPPVTFTCDITTTVEHVTMQAFCALEGKIVGKVTDYAVKPIGLAEWLSPSSKLSQLECVHNCLKLERDVQLGLCIKTDENMKAIARTRKDDVRDAELKPEDILPNEHTSTISYINLMILIETLETEIEKLEGNAADVGSYTFLSCSGVVQGVKAICALFGCVDTLKIGECVSQLKRICASGNIVYTYGSSALPDIGNECGDYVEVTFKPRSTFDDVKMKCNDIREAVQELIEIYAGAFRVDFCIKRIEYTTAPVPITHVLQPVAVNVGCLHRPPPHWKYDSYKLGAQIYHGTRYIGDPVVCQCTNDTSGGLFPRLKFDIKLRFENNMICSLPRESRLIFVLYGCPSESAEIEQSSDAAYETKEPKELGWCAIQFFDFKRDMICGSYLLSLWPPTSDKFLGPAPAKGSHPQPDLCPVLGIEIPNFHGRVVFPEPLQSVPPSPRYDFNSLDLNLQQELLDTAEQGYPGAVDKREVLWEKRHYLQAFPHALPKVLHAAHSWDFFSLEDLHSLIKSWQPLSPLQALELLLPRYPDLEVRAQAVKWISKMSNDQLTEFLPQLLQALKHDTYETSPMAKLLLSRSLESPRIAHYLYWLLVHNLPGDAPQNSINACLVTENHEYLVTQARYHRRNQIMLRSLLEICGEKLLSRFLSQNMMCKNLAETAHNVKVAKESMRNSVLFHGMETVHQILIERPTSLPLSPSFEVSGVSIRSCSYFNSNTLPLKIAFFGPDNEIIPAIFKCGDDLQQDMLTIQLVRIMDKLWLAEGLDLKMVTFTCVPTGYKKGMIELIPEAETLRKIQVEYGLTGSFKDKPIAEWLERQNPSQLEYERAVDNFTVSCAGYSVATYILGICDRHNDNIMLKTSGHLFHIDFGKFLGDTQMIGNIKRDRTPFVLTSDMAYVINGGDKPSTKFHRFVDLCCRAFNVVRKHGDLLLHMLALMVTAGIPGVTADAVTYVRNALLPSQSNPEAAATFAKMIQFSLNNKFTQFNFFIHNIAQFRFSNDDGNSELLSFVPRTFTMQQDGRLRSVTVHGFQKRYNLEKYYTYILKVTRQGQPDPAYLFRTYKEFLEFHQKLCMHFPLAKLHSPSSGIHVGRSNVKPVAERRLIEIKKFLVSLFASADEIAHSNLVYTFFHPLLRDQQEANIHVPKVKDVRPNTSTEEINGEIKISLQYRCGTLTVMIYHLVISGLRLPGGQEPNTYVKCYLKPDPLKTTKRKTKVVKRTFCPSFMETLEYRMPLEYVQSRILQVTVWTHDNLQENELLGGFELPLSNLDLSEELVQRFKLGYLPRR